jgi:peptidoglycan/xylan/chitin deacetylase (PgdA/CDA1 family)
MRVAVLAGLTAVLALAASSAQARRGPSQPPLNAIDRLVLRGRPVFCGGTGKRVFALTFDDGPSPWTETLVAALRRGHAPATFFLVGNRIPLWTTGAQAAAGQGDVGDHTWSHAVLTKLSRRRIHDQLEWTLYELRTRLDTTTELFRPPYDRVDAKVERVAASLGLLDVRWNVDSGDSRVGAKPRAVVREVVRNLKPGAIVLMHDTHPWTASVVRRVLAAAKRKHLQPLTVPQLLTVDPPTPEENCYAP